MLPYTGEFLSGLDVLNLVNSSVLVAAVPEPSTWAMIIIGFVGLGFAFHQSRRRGVAQIWGVIGPLSQPSECLLSPQQRTFAEAKVMSAKCQKQT
jgi:hypothetical protein